MKVFIVLTSFVFGLLACSSFEEPTPFQGNSASELPYRIKTRVYPTVRKGITYRATATYHYDSLNRLTRIDSTMSDRSILYRYADNRLSERLTISTTDGRTFFRETFEYDAVGRLAQSLWRTGDGQSQLQKRYAQDPDGRISRIETKSLNYTFNRVATYEWENGNVRRELTSDETGKRLYEYSYQYDEQPNHLALPPISPDPDDPFAQTRNNLITDQLDRDYTGLIDPIVNPARYRLVYNAAGLPVLRSFNYFDQYEEFTYEPKR
jgi:hypothetical protein